MEFCQNCNNKMNIKWKNNFNEDNSIEQKCLVYYCITCGI